MEKLAGEDMRRSSLRISLIFIIFFYPLAASTQEREVREFALQQLEEVQGLLTRAAVIRQQLDNQSTGLREADDLIAGAAGAFTSGLLMSSLCGLMLGPEVSVAAVCTAAAGMALTAYWSRLRENADKLDELTAAARELERQARQLLEDVIALQRIDATSVAETRIEALASRINETSVQLASVETSLSRLADCPGEECPLRQR